MLIESVDVAFVPRHTFGPNHQVVVMPLLPQIIRDTLDTDEGQEQAERMAVAWAERYPDDLVMVELAEDDEPEPAERPCSACPWVSRDQRDRDAVGTPKVLASLDAGGWFCCHVDLGTCHGAELIRAKRARQ